MNKLLCKIVEKSIFNIHILKKIDMRFQQNTTYKLRVQDFQKSFQRIKCDGSTVDHCMHMNLTCTDCTNFPDISN